MRCAASVGIAKRAGGAVGRPRQISDWRASGFGLALHSFSDRVCISEVVFVTLAEGLGISWRYLSHIMTERKQLASNIVRRHAGLDTNQARRNIRKPGPNPAAAKLLTQNNRPPVIQPDQMQRVLACINANCAGDYSVRLLRHGHAPRASEPPSKTVRGESTAGPSHSATLADQICCRAQQLSLN